MPTTYIPPKKNPPTDYPRDEIMRRATDAIARYGGPAHARVYFKFTCTRCGTRCTFQRPNELWEEGECAECGLNQPVAAAGFMLSVTP